MDTRQNHSGMTEETLLVVQRAQPIKNRQDIVNVLAIYEGGLDNYGAKCARIFFIAAVSIWRMRSAETPYLSVKSCNVEPF